jgi:ADP-ribose pyrophosphatase YjhB (NUDIX family)
LVEVVGAVLVSEDNRVLLGRRADNRQWATPGGKVDEGETREWAVLRELKEETGLTVPAGVRTVPLGARDDGPYRVYFYLVAGWRGFPRRTEPDKCTSWRWWPLAKPPAAMTPCTRWMVGQLPRFLAGYGHTTRRERRVTGQIRAKPGRIRGPDPSPGNPRCPAESKPSP